MSEFESLLENNKTALLRLINYRISDKFDAEDVYQEVVIDAYKSFVNLKNINNFKQWMLSIARNKINDYYRKKYNSMSYYDIESYETDFHYSLFGHLERIYVNDVLNSLSVSDREILELTYFQGYKQSELSEILKIPLGTVKSRQSTAREHFKNKYLEENTERRLYNMKKLPEYIPQYSIEMNSVNSNSVIFNEVQGLGIVPQVGNKSVWGIYDASSKKCLEYSELNVACNAEVHGVSGVEIISKRHDNSRLNDSEIKFVVQQSHEYIRYLSESHIENGTRKMFTFLDGDIFMKNWGFGNDNIGFPRELKKQKLINISDDLITYDNGKQIYDITGNYTINIFGKSYETVCLMMLGHFDGAIVAEQYIDKNGRTVLLRRFNKDNWAFNKYGKLWSEMLPDNEILTVNGEKYVHWCDSITDYII